MGVIRRIGYMCREGAELMEEISNKKEELYRHLKNGIGDEALRKSQELDKLIVKYMLKYKKDLK